MERVPCDPNPDCKFFKKKACYQNRHHLFYPKRDYQTPLEKKFREAHVQVMCRAEHEQIHLRQKPPEKPTPEAMKLILGECMERIRDYDGRPAERAAQIQAIVPFLGQLTGERVLPQKIHLERTELAQNEFNRGFDSMGDYHDPSLRLEK